MGLGNPNDIANACIYLMSDASRWVMGSNLVVDGGGIRRGEISHWCFFVTYDVEGCWNCKKEGQSQL